MVGNKKHPSLPRGLLKIKQGFNPNSSSIGTVVYSFPVAVTALSTVIAVITAVIATRRGKTGGDISDDTTDNSAPPDIRDAEQ